MGSCIMTFAIDFDWLDGNGIEGPDRYCWAEVGIKVGDRTIEAADLRLRNVRDRFVTSLLPFADWLVEVWPRLTEERTLEDPQDPHPWRYCHSFRGGRGGGPMPDVRLRRRDVDTYEIASYEDEQRPPGISLSFIANTRANAQARDVMRALSRLIEAVCEQLRMTDTWTFEHLSQRWAKALTPAARTAGRLGFTLEDLDELTQEDFKLLDVFASQEVWLSIAEVLSCRQLSELLADTQRITALLPSADDLLPESRKWQSARLESSGSAPWTIGWKAAELFRQRNSLDTLSPPGDELRPLLASKLDWPVEHQLQVLPGRRRGIDMVVVRPEGRMPRTLAWHVGEKARRFRVAKSLYYSLCSNDRLIVDSARTSGHGEANAFAAELLAPRAFIEQHVPPDGYWTQDDVNDVAQRCAVDPRVIEHQITNRSLGVLEL